MVSPVFPLLLALFSSSQSSSQQNLSTEQLAAAGDEAGESFLSVFNIIYICFFKSQMLFLSG